MLPSKKGIGHEIRLQVVIKTQLCSCYNMLYKAILYPVVIYQNLSSCESHITRSPPPGTGCYLINSLDIPVQIQKILDIMGLDLVSILLIYKPYTVLQTYTKFNINTA